jgi:hypothetical protein
VALTLGYDVAKKGITVPYGRRFRKQRRNHGFVDLRGRPDLAALIPEAAQSEALKALLVSLADASSPLSTLGCDLGAHVEGKGSARRHIAGGYVQVMRRDYARASADDYLALTRAISADLEEPAADHEWTLGFTLTSVDFKLDLCTDTIPSVQIWFFARADTPEDAAASRELLIEKLSGALGIAVP